MKDFKRQVGRKGYRFRLTKYAEFPLSCYKCREKVFVREMSGHVLKNHYVYEKKNCIWCGELFSKPGLHKNANHSSECLLKRIEKKTKRKGFFFVGNSLDTSTTTNTPTITSTTTIIENTCNIERLENNPSSESKINVCESCYDSQTGEIKLTCRAKRMMNDKDEIRPGYECFYEIGDLLESYYDWKYGRLPLDREFASSSFDSTDRGIYSEESGLGSDLEFVLDRFVCSMNTCWYHVMIKATLFDIFRSELLNNRSNIIVLPWSCLCDGFKKSSKIYRLCRVDSSLNNHDTTGKWENIHHRHMIIVSLAGSKGFQRFYERVQSKSKRIAKNEKLKLCKPIKTALHLARTIAYVSTPKSSCDGTIKSFVDALDDNNNTEAVDNNLKNNDNNNDDRLQHFFHHYFIEKPVMFHAALFISLRFYGGLQLYMLQCNNRKRIDGWQHLQKRNKLLSGKSEWMAPVLEACTVNRCVAPLKKTLQPDGFVKLTKRQQRRNKREPRFENDKSLYVSHDYVMKLSKNPSHESLSRSEWIRKQIEANNYFYEGLKGKVFYELSPRQKQFADFMEKFRSRCRIEMNRSKRKMRNDTNNKFRREITRLKRENETLRNELNELKLKMVQSECQREIDKVRSECQKEIEKVRSECQREIDKVRSECQREIDKVRSECQREIDKVRSECQCDKKKKLGPNGIGTLINIGTK